MINKLPLTNFDTQQAMEVVWEALYELRGEEREVANDDQWDEITTAMAWIKEALDDI